jgi:hypothetical protein
MRTSTTWGSQFARCAILLSVGLGACSTNPRPVSTTSVTIPHTDSVTVESRSNVWSPRITTGTWHYTIQDSSIVSISNDTSAHVHPIELRTIFSITITDSANILVLTGQVDSSVLDTHSASRMKANTGSLTVQHMILSKQGRVIDPPKNAAPTCIGINTASTRIPELAVVWPSTQVKIGDRWADTLSVTNCHGKIPLVQTAIREYELLDLTSCQQRDAVKVRRSVSDSFTGSSVDTTNHLNARGSGTASTILCVNRDTGTLLESIGQSRVDLTVVTTRGAFPFTQSTSTHIKLQ